jgi:Na+/H+-dicarboxylate symporter
MLQIVVFAILIGVAVMNISSERARPLLDLAASVQQLSMEIVSWAMVLAPLAVLGLLAQITMKVGLTAIVGMSVYVGAVLLGLFLLLVVYAVLVKLVAGWNIRRFFRAVREVQLLAFSTSSSAAVMPLSIETAQEKLGVQPSIAQFVVPLGATVNMDGTAMYQVIAAVFLTQVFGVELSTPALLLLIATTVGASIGSPSTPGVGIVILATILQGVGVPASGIALIIGVDRVLDMSRTAINVTGDLTACVVMNRWLPAPEKALVERAPRPEGSAASQ